MKKPLEVKTLALIPIYLGAGNAKKDEIKPAYRLRRQIKNVEGFIRNPSNGGCALSPMAPETTHLQIKESDPPLMWGWASAFLMEDPTPVKIDLLEELSETLSEQEAFGKLRERFIDDGDEETG